MNDVIKEFLHGKCLIAITEQDIDYLKDLQGVLGEKRFWRSGNEINSKYTIQKIKEQKTLHIEYEAGIGYCSYPVYRKIYSLDDLFVKINVSEDDLIKLIGD